MKPLLEILDLSNEEDIISKKINMENEILKSPMKRLLETLEARSFKMDKESKEYDVIDRIITEVKLAITEEKEHLEYFWWSGYTLERVNVDQEAAELFYNAIYNIEGAKKIIEIEKQ
jgi:hypothetical protein